MTRSPNLSGSWVVDDAGSDRDWSGREEDLTLSETDSPIPTRSQPRRRNVGRSQAAPSQPSGPDLVMPLMDTRSTAPSYNKSASRSTSAPRRTTPSSNPTPSRSIMRGLQPKIKHDEHYSFVDVLLFYVGAFLGTVLDIVYNSMKLLRWPIIGLVTFYLFLGMVMLMGNFLTNSVHTALTPICRLPGASSILPFCAYSSGYPGPDGSLRETIDASKAAAADPEFSSLVTAQNHLTEIMEDTSASLSLPLSMKRSESSIRDLRQIVRYSSLHSRHELVLEFDGFIETARTASFDLQKFNSHVGRAVDVTLSTARWTERILDDMAHKNSESENSLVPGFIRSLLYPFTPIPFTKSRLLDQYLLHTSLISDEIAKLIDEAQALLLQLQALEDRLEAIHSISLSSSVDAQVSKDEILSHLWTMLGGNRAQLSRHNHHLKLLRQVGEYRTQAFAHVSGTILKLQAMGAELEELKGRVDAAGLEQCVRKEVPLQVHIDSIRMGVERLELGRAKAREIEKGYVRRVIDVSETGELGVDEKRLGVEG